LTCSRDTDLVCLFFTEGVQLFSQQSLLGSSALDMEMKGAEKLSSG